MVIYTYSDGSILVRPPLWRIKHDKELGSLWRPGLPEVHPFLPNHFAKFTEPWQRKSRSMNPLISDSKWTVVYGYKLWITNENGFGDDSDPRHNYITRQNADAPDPKVEALSCGGSVITGYVSGSNLIVKILNWRDAPPDRPLYPWEYVTAVSVDVYGNPRRFPQTLQPDGSMADFRHPLLGDPMQFPVITFPLSKLQKWDRPDLPDPYSFYL